MSIMPRRCSKSAIIAQTAERKVKHALGGKCVRMLQEVKCDKTPVDAADSQVFGEMVLELIATLGQRQPPGPFRSS